MRNLYDVLGVPKAADQAAIKKAYKKLARENHPDLNKDPAAAERFKEISAAYEVLGDENKRALYDEFGDASLQAGFDADRARAWKSGGYGGYGGYGGFDGGGGVNIDDLFSSIFGMNNRSTTGRAARRTRGTDIESTLRIQLLDAIRGIEMPISVRRPSTCDVCSGQGGTGRTNCGTCGGSGRVSMQQFGMSAIVACDACGGSGSVFASECGSCAGTGRTMKQENLKVKIPAGVENNQVIRLRGKGGDGRSGGPAGDLLLRIEIPPHAFLRRDGDNLEMDVPITFSESLLGGQIQVPLPTGGSVKVTLPQGTKNGQKLRLKGKGIAAKSGAGDLYLVLRPTPPAEVSDEAAEAVKSLDALYGDDVRAELVM